MLWSLHEGHLGSVAQVVLGGEQQHPGLVLLRDGQILDQTVQQLFAHFLPTGHFFQLLVRSGHVVFAHEHLDGFGQDLPVVLEFILQTLLVHLQFVQSLVHTAVGQLRVPEGQAVVAHHGRVGQVALVPADRQFLGEVAGQTRGQSQVALRVLEVDRVHLVGHGGRADFLLLDLELEVAQ